MKARMGSIIGWTCAILVSLFNLFAAVTKYIPAEPGSEMAVMAQKLGIARINHILGVMEIAIIIIFLIPRTSTVGFVLMIGYMGGAFATNLTHGFTSAGEIIPFLVIFALLTISAWFRNPELKTRLFTGKA